MAQQTKRMCTECSKEFLVIPQEATIYDEKKLPLPDQCPACRHKRRMALRNERALHRRICTTCGSPMLTTYAPDAPYAIECQKCFWKHVG
ncbi:MAG: zinc-ribbon domain containing protein [Candidatus Peribacteraceae bacterium]|nr:zinc-ribbon domain containing protein [Candidatus Peribacteraceae bacterium]